MMTPTIPEPDSQIKALRSGPDIPPPPTENSGSIVFRFPLRGIGSVEIITDQSDEEDTLRQRLTQAGPALAFLRKTFTFDPVTNQERR